MYRRKQWDDEEESHERWLISYADFITLLFAFFVVMYATSTINLNKYRALSDAVVTAFQGKPGQVTTLDAQTQTSLQNQSSVLKPLPLSYLYQEKKQRDQEKVHAIGQQLANTLTPWIEQKLIAVYQSDLGIEVDIQSSLLFNSLQATYTPQALAVLNAAAGQLKNEYRTIQVEGHCDRHLFNGQADAETKRWELSAAQAAHVTASLAGQGIASKWLSATGMAETKPVSSSDNEFAQALNSRITLRILTAESSTQQSSNIANRQEIQPAIVPSPTLPETEPQILPAQATP
ncbi:flagellar motor protein MotB [Methylophilus methylotrophus]|uniref:flagellar motor protein MotB n=1 Tax=Methylophilus methylotrophus TaxID=17 RepID=UPI000F5A00F7|nr:flagellar motor protein MotB [Methylophilus methylotrophus]